MSGRMRSIVPSRSGLGLTLVLLLVGLLLSIIGCESLAPDTSASTETSTQTTVVEVAGSAEPFFGSWQGTYTTLEVRDQNGVVADSPVPLNTPLEMHLELQAWSEASGDCGTLTVAGYPNGRVLELSAEGQVVRLHIVNEAEGLEDSQSLMTLTLEGDTLTGADEPDPDVPEGWHVTTGSVYLTRTLSEATTTTEATVEESSAEPAPSPDEEEEVTEHEPTFWEWNNGDADEYKSVRVGDHIRIRVAIDIARECTQVDWRVARVAGDFGMLQNQGMAISKEGPFIVIVVKNFEVLAPGEVTITGLGRGGDPSEEFRLLDVHVTATE